MAFKFTYSFAIVVALSSRVALGHLVKCNGVTAPSGNFDDFFYLHQFFTTLVRPSDRNSVQLCNTQCV